MYRGCLGRRRRQFQETVVVARYESCSVAALLSLQPVLLMSVMRCLDSRTWWLVAVELCSMHGELSVVGTMR